MQFRKLNRRITEVVNNVEITYQEPSVAAMCDFLIARGDMTPGEAAVKFVAKHLVSVAGTALPEDAQDREEMVEGADDPETFAAIFSAIRAKGEPKLKNS